MGSCWWHYASLLKQRSGSDNEILLVNWLLFLWNVNITEFGLFFYEAVVFSMCCVRYWFYLLVCVAELHFQILNLSKHEFITEEAVQEHQTTKPRW